MPRFGIVFDRFGAPFSIASAPFLIENGAETIENSAETIENGAVFDCFGAFLLLFFFVFLHVRVEGLKTSVIFIRHFLARERASDIKG